MTDNSVWVHQKELPISNYEIIEIKWNKFLDLFRLVFVKKSPMMQY